MGRSFQFRWPLLACASLLWLSPDACAGWITVKNETKTAILIQEVPARPTLLRRKPIRLLPGEVYREYHSDAGEKQLRVLDAKDPNVVLCEVKVKWPVEDVALRIRLVEKATKLEPVAAKPGAPEAIVTAVKKE